ncbi:MAG TPA: large conductance mechanosensitive channel protein MscL [Chitinophagaceae bacterium]|nr:large conductance mechanosensitive channel protein MscL [Chitinophagaceae bacterium]
MAFIKEFKLFVMKGNMLELAIALVMGVAFGKIITSLVDNIIMPFIGSLIGSNFATLTAKLNGVDIKYGMFIQAMVDFFIIAFIVFLIIKAMNKIKKKEAIVAEISSTDKLLMEIKDVLIKREVPSRDPDSNREPNGRHESEL